LLHFYEDNGTSQKKTSGCRENTFDRRSMMLFRSMFFIIFGLGIVPVSDAAPVCFFVTAHQDDGPLFMNPDIYFRIRGAPGIPRCNKTVFINVNAGNGGTVNFTYYHARELGLEDAIRFMVDGAAKLLAALPAGKYVSVNGRNIYYHSYRNTETYFLRIPDGGVSGDGNQSTGYQSLEKLLSGEISSIETVDGTVYTKAQLIGIVLSILQTESSGSTDVFMGFQQPDKFINPGDHSDHMAAGTLALEAVGQLRGRGCIALAQYDGYNTSKRKVNLTPEQSIHEVGTYAVHSHAVQLRGGKSMDAKSSVPGRWDSTHLPWLNRLYRTEGTVCPK
jgi:hypothetical protein